MALNKKWSQFPAAVDVATTDEVVGLRAGVNRRFKNVALDTSVVHKTGNETISGVKTFTSPIASDITGNSATVTTNANLTGPIRSVGNATSIEDSSITLAKIEDVAPLILLGNPEVTSQSPSLIPIGSGLEFSGGELVTTTTNALNLTGSDLKSTVNGVDSNTVDLSPILPPVTTNTLLNNGDNTMTSTVDTIDSTAPIVVTNAISLSTNQFSTQVNGFDSGPVNIVATNALSLTGTNLQSSVNSFDSNTVDIQIPIASPINNNLVSMDATGHVKDSAVAITTSSSSNTNDRLMTSAAVQMAIAAAAAGGFSFRGTYDASGGAYPSTGGSGALGVIQRGDVWTISVGGTLPGSVVVLPNDSLLATVNTPGQTPANWIANSSNVVDVFGRVGSIISQTGDYAVGQITGAAPLASPTFTGTPAAPTQAQSDNSTKLATTAYVDTGLATKEPTITTLAIAKGGTGQASANSAFNALAPSQTTNANKILKTDGTDTSWVNLSTLGVSSFNTRTGAVVPATADYTVSQVTGAAPLASPTFTGTPAAPTPTLGDNTTKLATTAFTQAAIAAIPATTNVISSAVNTMTSVVNSISSNTPIVNSSAISTSVNNATVTINGVASSAALIINSNSLSSSVNTITSAVNGVSSNTPLVNSSAVSTSANNITVTINGVASSTAPLINTHTLTSAVNTMTDVVNGVSANASIINTNTMTLASNNGLTNSTNGVTTTSVYVCPSPETGGTSATFTNLGEYIIAVAAGGDAIGTYILRLYDSTNKELNIIFTVCANNASSYNNSYIQILQVNDTEGVINATNISSYVLFRGFYRSNASNPYFVVTLSTPYTLIYSNPLNLFIYQYASSFYTENTNVTGWIGFDISNLVATTPPDLIVKMKTVYVPTTVYNPQGYLYIPAGGSNAVYQYSINATTGALTGLSPSTVAVTGAYKAAITKLRNYIYVTNGSIGTNLIYQFRISATNGTISALGTPTIGGPADSLGIAIDPTDRFLYVCGYTGAAINQYSITKSTGQLVALSPASVAGATGMRELAVHPSGKFLYAVNGVGNTVYQYSINASTGVLTALGTPTIACGTGPLKIVIHPSGLYAYVSNNGAGTISQYSINTTTGQLTALSPATFTTASGMYGLTISNNGLFIYYGCSNANIIGQSTIDPATGLISTPTTSLTVNGARDCNFDYSGNFLFVIGNTANQVSAYTISQTTGAMTLVGAVSTGTVINGLEAA